MYYQHSEDKGGGGVECDQNSGQSALMFTGRMNAEAETLILWPPDAKKSQLTGKDPSAGKDWGQEKKGMTEDEIVGWHHWLSGHEFEQTLGDGEGQGSLACCSQPMGSQRVGHDWATGQQQPVTGTPCLWLLLPSSTGRGGRWPISLWTSPL